MVTTWIAGCLTVLAAADAPAPSAEPDLSVARVEIPLEDRPAWVEVAPVLDGDVHFVSVSSGPHARLRDAERALDEALLRAVHDYVNDYLNHSAASTFIRYDLNEIRRRLVAQPAYGETILVSFGPMHQAHAQLQFDGSFRRELDSRWDQVVATTRLMKTGLGSFAVLAMLGLMLTYFRLDTATRGYYTRRLQIAVAGAILAVVAAGLLLGRWIPSAVVYLVT